MNVDTGEDDAFAQPRDDLGRKLPVRFDVAPDGRLTDLAHARCLEFRRRTDDVYRRIEGGPLGGRGRFGEPGGRRPGVLQWLADIMDLEPSYVGKRRSRSWNKRSAHAPTKIWFSVVRLMEALADAHERIQDLDEENRLLAARLARETPDPRLVDRYRRA